MTAYLIEKIHSFGSGQVPPPIYFSRSVKTIEEVREMIFSGILNDCDFFSDGYTSDDDCVDKDGVYNKARNLSDIVVTELNYKPTVEIESHTSPHNYYTWRVQIINT